MNHQKQNIIGNKYSSCPHCAADLTQKNSVVREYINKDNDESGENAGEDVQCYGHFEKSDFEADTFGGFGGGRFDLNDDSDKCVACDGQL